MAGRHRRGGGAGGGGGQLPAALPPEGQLELGRRVQVLLAGPRQHARAAFTDVLALCERLRPQVLSGRRVEGNGPDSLMRTSQRALSSFETGCAAIR